MTREQAEARFDALYRASAPDLLRFLTRRAADAEEATDLLAEVYIVAWRRLEKIPNGNEARLWLFGVARNVLMKSRERSRSNQALVQGLTDELKRTPAFEAPEPDQQLSDATRAGLENLPPKQREVMLLAAWEELKPREIAKVTGSTANVVRVRLHHARRQLARDLRPPNAAASDREERAADRSSDPSAGTSSPLVPRRP